jgi:thiosulfate/3-mercaptopyruvate sulfurtransferase
VIQASSLQSRKSDRPLQGNAMLISPEELQLSLAEPALRLFDTTVLMRPVPTGYEISSGRESWQQSHIPGAAFMDLLTDLADQTHRLRFMMPPEEQLVRVLSELGIDRSCRVVLYNAGPTWWATRAFFMLRAVGFDAVQVLDGGLDRWRLERRPLESGARSYVPARFTLGVRRAVFVDKTSVLAAMRTRDRHLMHALSPAVFSGEVVSYGRPGHIPGSVNLFATGLLDPATQAFLPREALRQHLAAVGVLDEKPTIAYCGGGISATTNAFALLLLGREDVQIYDASMTEWGPDPTLPMETGPANVQ